MSQQTTTDTRSYKSIFFDLDGTLLPMDIDEFMGAYMAKLGSFMVARGADPQAFGAGMKQGIKAMARHNGDITNEDAFYEAFYECVDKDALDWTAAFMEFYETEFDAIGAQVVPNPAASQALETLARKGYTLVLTTMPMFPQIAVRTRLKWAGVDPSLFSRITSFENSSSIKPHLTYYAENLAAVGLRGSDVLMVGNNTVEDLSALDMGTDAYLVTDYLLDPVDYDLSSVKHGSMEDFARWVEELPPCSSGAEHVETGAVSWPRVERAYGANVVMRRSNEELEKAAAGAYTVTDQGVSAKRRPSAPPIAKPACPKED